MRSTRLPNGVRVVSETLADLPSVTAGIWVENGSRYERPEQAGISHFLEHLFFKGTERRTATGIAEEMDAVGGVLNAFTSKEYTCYYAKVLREHLPLGLDLLADMFRHSTFPAEEVERERSVIIQEISQTEDTPDEFVHELFNAAFWPGHPLARPILGTADTVSGLHRQHFVDFMQARYRPDRILIAAAGNVTHEELLDVAQRHFGDLSGTAVPVDGEPPTHRAGVSVHEKDLEQVHVLLGTPGIVHVDDDRYAAHLLVAALGGGMSSRFFQEIRERRGKAYTVYSSVSPYIDAGYVLTYVGTSAEWVREVVEIIRAEQRRTANEGLTPAELARVKNQAKGGMLLSLETSESRMFRIAKNMIHFGRDLPLAEVAAAIDAVTNDEIVRVAQRVFPAGAFGLTVLGDMKGHALGDEVLRE
jgi:predicted Zn-dependent peptidase